MEFRRTIEEVVSLYTLEPQLKDIYVEGNRDRCTIEWVLNRCDLNEVHVHTVDEVEISNDILRTHGLPPSSNRSRIIALAVLLDGGLQTCARVLCIADRDFEDYIPSGASSRYLVFTDYNSMEIYTLNEDTMDKFFKIVLGGFPIDTSHFMKNVVKVLEKLYLFRLANERLSWGMSWIETKGYISITGAKIFFDSTNYIKAYLQHNRKWSKRDLFLKTTEKISSELQEEFRRKIRGHDLTNLLFYICKKLKSHRRFGNVETFEGSLLGCLELAALEKEGLFRRILSL